MSDLSFLPLMLDISAVYLTTDDKIKLIFHVTFKQLTSEFEHIFFYWLSPFNIKL